MSQERRPRRRPGSLRVTFSWGFPACGARTLRLCSAHDQHSSSRAAPDASGDGRTGVISSTPTVRPTSTPAAARRSPASATGIPASSRRSSARGRLAYAHTSFFTTEPAERLADRLVARAPGGSPRLFRLRRVGSDGGGAQAGAAVFRRDRRAASAAGSSPGGRATTATRSARWRIGGNAWRREPFLPLLAPAIHRFALLRLPRAARRRERRRLWRPRSAAELEAAIVAAGLGASPRSSPKR